MENAKQCLKHSSKNMGKIQIQDINELKNYINNVLSDNLIECNTPNAITINNQNQHVSVQIV